MAVLDLLNEASRLIDKRRVIAKHERMLYLFMLEIFRKQRDLFLKKFVKLKDHFPLQEAINPDDFIPYWREVELETMDVFVGKLSKHQRELYKAGGTEVFAKLNISASFDLTNTRAVQFLRQNAAERVTKINETTREVIKRIMVQGVNEGWSYGKMAKSIKDRFNEFSAPAPQRHIRNRAELVAVTESAHAYVSGNMEAGRQLKDTGIVLNKSWLTVGDERVCEICGGNESQGSIGFDELFASGVDAPPGHPACRCDILIEPNKEQ